MSASSTAQRPRATRQRAAVADILARTDEFDLHVFANELQPRFTRLLGGTGANNDHSGVGAIRVGAL